MYSFAVYIAANVFLAYSPNLPFVFVFRGLQAFGSASVVSIGKFYNLSSPDITHSQLTPKKATGSFRILQFPPSVVVS